MRILVIVLALSLIELVALLKGVDGTALAAFWAAIGVALGVGGRKVLERRKK